MEIQAKIDELILKTNKEIENLEAVRNHLLESHEYELVRATKEKIIRYRRDIKLIKKVCELLLGSSQS
jgi:hypothetical protein